MQVLTQEQRLSRLLANMSTATLLAWQQTLRAGTASLTLQRLGAGSTVVRVITDILASREASSGS